MFRGPGPVDAAISGNPRRLSKKQRSRGPFQNHNFGTNVDFGVLRVLQIEDTAGVQCSRSLSFLWHILYLTESPVETIPYPFPLPLSRSPHSKWPSPPRKCSLSRATSGGRAP